MNRKLTILVILGANLSAAPLVTADQGAGQKVRRGVAFHGSAPSPLQHVRVDSISGDLEFIESVPVETTLDLPAMADARDVWPRMIGRAQQTIDIATFYFSARPDGPGALVPVIAALDEAAARGVKIRALCDAGFARTYPDIPAHLNGLPGAESRAFDVRELWGGVLHAKCFLVDEDEFFLGSQNWDWRALEHIHELGVRVRSKELAANLRHIFELDWALAGGQKQPPTIQQAPPSARYSTALSYDTSSSSVKAQLAASPPHALPDGIAWDEQLLVEMMDAATQTLRLQLLSYNPTDREGNYYHVLENALRRAAARGVQVQILLSNWAKRSYMLGHILSLAATPNIEVRFTNIPQWSEGFVPYARVDHAKFLLADDRNLWLGTANWSRSYFHTSRNISLFLRFGDGTCPAAEFFARGWDGPYAESVDPCGEYAPPRIGD